MVTDRRGVPVSVALDEPGLSYTVALEGAGVVGRAYFIPGRRPPERIFYHTVVDDAFAGRGLAGLLVQEALADSIRRRVEVVATCPLFAKRLREHGDEYTAAGGVWRRPDAADITAAKAALAGKVAQ